MRTRVATRVLSIGLVVFHLYTGLFGTLIAPQQRAIHVGLAIALAFLVVPTRRNISGSPRTSAPWWDWLFALAILTAVAYPYLFWQRYLPVMMGTPTGIELVFAVVTVVLVLEAARRSVGVVLPLLTVAGLFYALWGHYIPGFWGHAPIAWRWISLNVYFSNEGLWGSLTGLSASYLALFIIFGGLLFHSGGGRTFMDIALLLTGRFRGGPAKVSVISSSLFGMLSGSSIANVATTGSFTIPLMKRMGYKPEFAGAVEAVASTGGMLMPPIMASAAFIMAELLGITYFRVVMAAFIPSLLFYISVFMGVDLQAVKSGLKGMPSDELPRVRDVISWGKLVPIVLPICTLLYLLIAGYSLPTVGGGACAMVILTYVFSDFSLQGIKQRLWKLPSILEGGGRAILNLVPLMASASMFVGTVLFTGLATKLASVVGGWEGSLFTGLVFTAILVMALGAGLPLVPAYLVGYIVAMPMLVGWGMLPLAGHMFILYYAILSAITPPVCAAVFVASGIAQSGITKTGIQAMKLSPLLYIMPFLWVYSPSFLMVGDPVVIVLDSVTALGGAIILVCGLAGQFLTKSRVFGRILLIVSGVLLLVPELLTDLVGGIVLVGYFVKQFRQVQMEKSVPKIISSTT